MDFQRRNFDSIKIIKNKKGFVLVLMLALMPLIMSAMVAFLLLNSTLQTWMQTAHICRTELLNTQTSVALDLAQLLKTNPVVKSLRTEILATELAIVAATAAYQFYAVPPLKKTLLSLKNQERALGVLQRSLVASATLKMNAGALNAQRKIQDQYQELTPKFSQFASLRLRSIYYRPSKLAVKPDSPSAPAAVYELEDDFKQKQSVSLFWSTEVQILKSQWSKNWFGFKSQKNESCASTLEDEGEEWQSILNEDRSFSK